MTVPKRNDPCPCGSGKKYKKCCLVKVATSPAADGQTISQLVQTALRHQQADRLPQAEALYRQVLQQQPNHPDALHLLGMLLHQAGNSEMAVALINRAILADPGNPVIYYNLGTIYQAQQRPEEAAGCYQKACALKPDFAEAYNNLGNALKYLGKLDDAAACYQRAIALKPDFVEAINNLGNTYHDIGKLERAMDCYQKVPALKPDYAEAHDNPGNVFKDLDKMDEALACYRRALLLAPEFHAVRSNLLRQHQGMCEWGTLETDIQIVRQAVREATASDNNRIEPFTFLALPGATAPEQQRCAEKWVHVKFQQMIFLGKKLGFTFKREPGQKVRVGYLSADFHDHATSRLMVEAFELHDHSRFHITAYSYGPDDGSAMRARVEAAFDRFVDIRDDTIEVAAQKIHADQIDILVDLKGYTEDTRSAILALRPAPVQVNYLGYPGTMGADFVDYLIADRFIIPPEHFGHYTEKVVWLPDCYQPNDRTRRRRKAPTRESCGLPEDGVVFCCFNQTYKITPEVFDVWCRLLKAVPGSVLWLLASNPYAQGNLRREAEQRGVAGERLVMAPLQAPEEHLARLQCADLFLDTIPYNAHTTCSDALWMGLPVITCAGDTFPSRVAGSLLMAMGMPELITYNLEDYYSLALSLALDRGKRDGMRNKIIAHRDTAPLFDSERFTRNLEIAYGNIWAEYGEGR